MNPGYWHCFEELSITYYANFESDGPKYHRFLKIIILLNI